jgi:hypothetical protein
MSDNFDLKKFLKESKAIENLNPVFHRLNENKKTETTKTTLVENNLRAKIREMVLAELGGRENYNLGDDIYNNNGEEDPFDGMDINFGDEDEIYEGGGNNFTWVWDKSKLTRTSYNNGKYNTSEKFKSLEDLLANKEKADEIQKRREEKGRDKIEHILKEEDENKIYEISKHLSKFKDYKDPHPEIYARMLANWNSTGKNPFFPSLQLDMVDWEATKEGHDFWEDVYDGRFEDAYNYIKYHGDELYEAKKDKAEDMPADDEEIDLELEPETDAPEAELTAAASSATGDAKELINNLMASLDTAKAMGNEKLTTQILNTLKFAIDQSMAQ